MRWKKKEKLVPEDGAKVTFEKFLLLPKFIGDEWVWLEKVLVEKNYHSKSY